VARITAAPLDDADALRRADRELLSLALIDARNALLAVLAAAETPRAMRRALHAGWYQERWISRHLQRQRGEAADPRGPLLAGIEPQVEDWLRGPRRDQQAGGAPPAAGTVRSYLAATLELTLEMLEHADDDDAGLYFFRLALLHEDRLGEALAEDLDMGAPHARAERAPIWFPAQRFELGSPPGSPVSSRARSGLVPHNERWAHEVALPEFEIDAQPVTWRQYVEFAEDGGYDRRACWSDAGWAFLEAGGRRAPRGVEQLAGGVLVERGGRLQKVNLQQPVLHVTRFEAEAWCRWAARRLPTEPEWEAAACAGAGRGFAWGDVFEWVAGSARAWPGAGLPGPGCLDRIPPAGTQGVLRGASFASRARQRHPKARRFMAPQADHAFCGFRSCAI
jgi:formylglycine-generating enzyme required for sulfatase activity